MDAGIVLVWLLIGLGAGYIYQRKGRSWLVAFVAGILLGPIALLLALVSAPSSKGLAKQQERNEAALIRGGRMKRCPHCAEMIRSEATFCKHCKQAIPT
jgi:hypothetical protein